MAILGETQQKQLEAILAWGSLSYALGFVTVMAHTARLGIPVIQLIEPIYILVGSPIAIVAFFSRKLWLILKSRTNKLRERLNTHNKEISDILTKSGDLESVKEAEDYLSEKLGKFFNNLFPGVGSVIFILFYIFLKKSRLRTHQTVAQVFSAAAKIAAVIRVTYESFLEIRRYAVFIFLISLVPIGTYLYIIYVYPSLPQSLGGGKSVPVKLILDGKQIPQDTPELRMLFEEEISADKSDLARTTARLEMLYYTDSFIYVRAPGGTTISFDRKAVKGIIW